MSSGQVVIPFTRQYNSFRVNNGLINGTNSNVSGTTTRSDSLSNSKQKPTMTHYSRNGITSDDTVITANNGKVSLTPRLCRKSGTQASPQVTKIIATNKLNLKSSPLRSPQIIRSTKVDSNWNKRVVKNGSLGSKSPGSSGTSVESIVPKYGNNSALVTNRSTLYNGNSNSISNANSGSQKRAYNINNTSSKSNKMINTRNNERTGTLTNHTMNGINNNNNTKHSTNGHTTSNNNHSLNLNGSRLTTNKSKENNYTAYSSKYPNGLPFEDEFYHRRRKSLSETSSNTLSSDSDSSDSRNFTFGDDEFTRKPSNEALYVDFTKSFHDNESKKTSTATTPTNKLIKTTALSAQPIKSNPLSEYNKRTVSSSSNHTNNLYKFENGLLGKKSASASVINGYNKHRHSLLSNGNSIIGNINNNNHLDNNNSSSNGNIKTAAVNVINKPVVYVSSNAASWVPKVKQITINGNNVKKTNKNVKGKELSDQDDDTGSDTDESVEEDLTAYNEETNRSNSYSDYAETAKEPTINGLEYVLFIFFNLLFLL